MKPPENDSSCRLSRRDFIGRTLGTGLVIPFDSLFSRRLTNTQAMKSSSLPVSIAIFVEPPAGPSPLGAPVETCVPFARGQLFHYGRLAVFSPSGQPVITQTRVTMAWPDGSVRWLSVAFEPVSGPGTYSLKEGDAPVAPQLVSQDDKGLTLDSGEVTLTFLNTAGGNAATLFARGADGQACQVSKGLAFGDLVLTRHDGKIFRAALAGDARQIIIEDRGPVRAAIRFEGKCRAQDGAPLFDFAIRWTVFRSRPEVLLTVTWINTCSTASEQIRDIRMVFPFDFTPERLVFGCERGVYDGPFLKDWPVYLLQDDHNRYWAKTLNPDGRVQNLSSGGCNGEHCPGWLYVQNSSRSLGVWVPDFWEEYPNEVYVKAGELSVGLWPERATSHLLSKPLLPRDPFHEQAYSNSRYWPVMPHPYVAFVDAEKNCLDSRQGMAKTQEIVLSVWVGNGEMPSFEKKWWSKSLHPVRGHLDPDYVASTGALGPLWPRDPKRFEKFEQLFDESFAWLDRHIDLLQCYGKFDYGDFKYMTASTDYMCHPGTKWGDMGEMPREGYWHNNERDPLLGLLLYYFRSGNAGAWERSRIVARHLLDIDISHYPIWGMWTHSYGHCYLALGKAGAPDHSWLLGLMAWAGASGDPLAWDWIKRCGKQLREQKRDFGRVDARTVSVYLHMMCQFYSYTGQAEYLNAAQAPAETLLKLQNPNGSWWAYLGKPPKDNVEGFVEHAVVALADYYALRPGIAILKALDRALVYLFGDDQEKPVDVGETPLVLYALAVLTEATGAPRYAALANGILGKLHEKLNLSSDPYGRGDPWAGWGVNNPDVAQSTGRPPQFLGQTRPLTPACTLAYGQQCMAAIAKLQKKS
ncbi:MAG TPA: hypothetical protein VMW38_09840 [Terriglobia bacterium]|nr:hypothetical protein [Terriglobia bacterium]